MYDLYTNSKYTNSRQYLIQRLVQVYGAHMLAGVVNDEAPGTLARKASTDSVLRSSSSEDDFYPGPPPRSQQMMRLLSLGSTVSSTSDVDVESPAENEDKDKIKHSGFCGYDSMLGISPPTTPGFDQMVPRRRILPASRASRDSSIVRPAYSSTPTDLGARTLADTAASAEMNSQKSPSKGPNKVAWSALVDSTVSDRIQAAQVPGNSYTSPQKHQHAEPRSWSNTTTDPPGSSLSVSPSKVAWRKNVEGENEVSNRIQPAMVAGYLNTEEYTSQQRHQRQAAAGPGFEYPSPQIYRHAEAPSLPSAELGPTANQEMTLPNHGSSNTSHLYPYRSLHEHHIQNEGRTGFQGLSEPPNMHASNSHASRVVLGPRAAENQRPIEVPSKPISILHNNARSKSEQVPFQIRQIGMKSNSGLPSQTGQYGQGAGVLENPDSSSFEQLQAIRTMGSLHASGMFEARQPLIRAVESESQLVSIVAIHELMAAPGAAYAIGLEERMQLERALVRILDGRDDGSGLHVVALNALAHIQRSGAGEGAGHSYMIGVVASLSESPDAEVRGAAVKALGTLCSTMSSHYSDRLLSRLQDSDAVVRQHAVHALARIGAWGGNDDFAAQLLRCCSDDPSPSVQRASVDTLVAALNGQQAASARAVIKRVLQQRGELQLPPLVLAMLE